MSFKFFILIFIYFAIFTVSSEGIANKQLNESDIYNDEYYINLAIEEAQKGLSENGIPIGSVIVNNANNTNKLIGSGHNLYIQTGSPIQHGEMNALDSTRGLPIEVYRNSTLYTTLSPCSMCTGAIDLYKFPRVVICENKSLKSQDGEDLLRKRGVEVIVLNLPECINMMGNFKKNHPDVWNTDIGVITDENKNTKSLLIENDENTETILFLLFFQNHFFLLHPEKCINIICLVLMV